MKKSSILVGVVLAFGLLAFKPVDPAKWSSDNVHSRLGFTVTHLGVTDFNGNFGTYEVKISSSKPDFSDAVVEMSGDAASINTDNADRDKHMKAPDFLDTEKFPKFSFKSTSFKKTADKEYKVMGQLTLHGVTKEVSLNARLKGTTTNPMSKKEVAGFKVSGTFKRSDFGIGASVPDMMLSDIVTLNADLEMTKD